MFVFSSGAGGGKDWEGSTECSWVRSTLTKQISSQGEVAIETKTEILSFTGMHRHASRFHKWSSVQSSLPLLHFIMLFGSKKILRNKPDISI